VGDDAVVERASDEVIIARPLGGKQGILFVATTRSTSGVSEACADVHREIADVAAYVLLADATSKAVAIPGAIAIWPWQVAPYLAYAERLCAGDPTDLVGFLVPPAIAFLHRAGVEELVIVCMWGSESLEIPRVLATCGIWDRETFRQIERRSAQWTHRDSSLDGARAQEVSRMLLVDRFSNGDSFNLDCRQALAYALHPGRRFGDPSDVHAPFSFHRWLHESPNSASGRRERTPKRVPMGRATTALFGYFRAEFGIGESGRSLVRAFDAAALPRRIHDISDSSAHRKEDHSFSEFDETSNAPIAILSANPDQFDVLDRQGSGKMFAAARYRIGSWWYELPTVPESWQPHFERVDEVWAGSRFVASAMKRSSGLPVEYVPPIVEPRYVPRRDQRRPRAGSAPFVFLFLFDHRSSIDRKNPEGVIRAFQLAFPAGARHVSLVIKSINAHAYPDEHSRLHELCRDDDRIRILTEYLARDEVYELIAGCDAYVSLHRSEGFGLTIAEAMYFAKPTIVTDWSGNMDYTDHSNSYLVPSDLVEIQSDSGPYFRGGTWAEPRLGDAAESMIRVTEDRAEARRRGLRGQVTVRSMFSRPKVALMVRRRIDAIARAL
jgi:glycosyltransferase involved in cell wall biosynthesis